MMLYGKTTVNFAPIFKEVHSRWILGAVGEIWDTWDPWLDRIGRIAIIGGGAKLCGPVVDHPDNLANEIFFVPDHPNYPNTPQICNSVGLHPHFLYQEEQVSNGNGSRATRTRATVAN
jgi:hypothetical protein